MEKKAYFDLHFHPVFKQYLARYEEGASTRSAEDLEAEIYLTNDLLRFLDRDFLHILGSQTSIHQMRAGSLTLGVANIVPLEYGIASSKGLLGEILRSNVTRPVDKTYFNKVMSGEISYCRLFLYELSLYKRLQALTANGGSGNTVRILSRDKSIDLQSENGICLALGLEGGHSLCRDLIGKPGVPDQELEVRCKTVATRGNAADSFQDIMTYLWNNGLDLMYLTLTHLTHISQQLLATHAYGMKLLRHVAFYPQGSGITEVGKDVVRTAYSLIKDNAPRPVLIDIKHMSLQSRLEFYEYRRELEQSIPVYPIMATHMGVTGYTISDWKAAKLNAATYLKNEGEGAVNVTQLLVARQPAGKWGSQLNNEFSFNPWSINLMDEDIREVLLSGGLIGMSLDVRILGFQQKVGLGDKHPPEYFSPSEFKKLFGAFLINDHPIEDERDDQQESWLVPAKNERQPLSLSFNIIHILTVARQEGIIGAEKQICIGSDFDGLIDPVVNCPNASGLSNLETALIKWLPIAAKAYAEEHGTENVIKNVDIKSLVRDILYCNGKAFVIKWLRGEFQGKSVESALVSDEVHR